MASPRGHIPESVDHRREMLLQVVNLCRPQDAETVLGRHPKLNTRQLGKESSNNVAVNSPEAIVRLLLADLQRESRVLPASLRGSDSPRVAPEMYWLRRRRISCRRAWKRKAGSLPPYWDRVVSMGLARFEQMCVRIGTEMIGHAALLERGGQLVQWLEPLGIQRARQVVDRATVLRDDLVSADLAERWNHSYCRQRDRCRGARIPFALGLGLMCSVYQHLTAEDRAVVAAVCDVGVREALNGLWDTGLCAPECRECVDRLLTRLVASES
ncbi:MAG: hypothetical protein KAV82_03755 [Phycisphaerae bacterium]|nr:hypothetical protein [Phycisphaerae bacterium]